jgi:hypothetical protein
MLLPWFERNCFNFDESPTSEAHTRHLAAARAVFAAAHSMARRKSVSHATICWHKTEFSFLNGNLVVPADAE